MNPDRGARRTGTAVVALSVALLLSAGTASPAIAQADTLGESVIVELRLGAVASRTVEGYRVGEQALIPLSQFFDMAEIRASITPGGRVTAALQPENVPLAIDPVSGVATLGRRRVTTPPGTIRVVNGEVFFPAERLGELLDAPIYVDWSSLEVVMRDPGPLPVAQQLRRRAARLALMREGGAPVEGVRLPADRPRWDGFVLDYSLLAPSQDPLGASAYAVQGGADLFGGSLELGASSIGRADAGDVRLDASWLGVWRESRVLKQLRLGDGLVSGPRSRSMRGISATNAPFLRPSVLGVVPYAGRLPVGWGVEAYRAGQLIAFDSTDAEGDFTIGLPVLYGENPVQFVAYGPYGETRVFGRTYRVSSALLPARRFEYAVSGGQCRFIACAATGNLDLRYGVSRRWTVQAGADRFWRDSLADLFHPYGAVTGSVTNALTLQIEGVANAFARGGLAYEPSLDTRLSVEYTRFDTSTTAPLLTLPGRRSLLQLAGFYRPNRDRDFFYFEADAQHARTGSVTTDRARVGASFQAGAIRVLPYARLERDAYDGSAAQARGFIGFTTTVLPRQSWGRVLGRTFIRGALEAQGLSAMTVAAIAIARPLSPGVRLEVGMNWARGFRGPAYTMTLSSYLRSFRSYTTASAQRGAPAQLSELVQGSVLYDRVRGNVHLAPGPSLQRAGIAGRVFLDANGNGHFDAGEQGLANVRVQVGSNNAMTDSAGAYRLWDVVPFEPVAIAVDSLSFESPLWVPARLAVIVAAGPNRYTIVDIPIVLGSVVEGRVLRMFGGAPQGVGGASLTLVDDATGRRQTMATFTDGSFYLLGVRPGRYTLSVDERVLDLLRMRGEPRRFEISASGDGPGALDLTLTPRP